MAKNEDEKINILINSKIENSETTQYNTEDEIELSSEVSSYDTEEERELYLPDKIDDNEELVYDRKSYHFFYDMEQDWPALTLDSIDDRMIDDSLSHRVFVSGSQASIRENNKIYLINMREIKTGREMKTKREKEEDNDSSVSDDTNSLPTFNYATIQYDGYINRMRSQTKEDKIYIGCYGENSLVEVYELRDLVEELHNKKDNKHIKKDLEPVCIFKEHMVEGFAIDWSINGELATGDFNGNIYAGPFEGRSCYKKSCEGTIEDVSWVSENSFIGAGSSGIVYLWDKRAGQKPQMEFLADTENIDINSVDVNRYVNTLIVTGNDDGRFTIWDTRNNGSVALSNIKWHSRPISSVHWSPHDKLSLLVAEDGRQITLWDFSVVKEGPEKIDIPDQLLFIHRGQKYTKDARWDSVISGMVISTAEDGYNIFKPVNF